MLYQVYSTSSGTETLVNSSCELGDTETVGLALIETFHNVDRVFLRVTTVTGIYERDIWTRVQQ